MDLVELGGKTVAFGRNLLRVIEAVNNKLQSLDETVNRIEAAINGQDPGDEVQAVLEDLGLVIGDIEDHFNQNRDNLKLLTSTLGDLGDRSVDWELSEDVDANVLGGDLRIKAELAARIGIDDDGETADGRILFDPSDERLLQIAVRGELDGSIDAKRNLGDLKGTVGVDTGASVEAVNYFLHSKNDSTLPAVLKDLTDFRLPGRLDQGASLRGIETSEGILIPAQWVQWTAQGHLGVSGSLNWSQSWATSATLSHEGLGIDEVLPIQAGASLGVDFSYRLDGFYDVLVRCADHDSNRVLVELHKRRRSETHLGIDIGAQVEVRGLDRVGRSLLGRFEPKLDRFLEKAEELKEFSDLEGLLTEKLDEELDDLLDADVLGKLEAGLKKVGQDTDLKAKLKELSRNKILKVTEDLLDDLQDNVDEVLQPFLEMIERIRDIQRKVHGALDKAAKLKVALNFSHERNRVRENEALLSFEVDPTEDPHLYRSMLLGNFDAALEAAKKGDNTLELKSGILREKGSLTITNDLNLTAFGITIGNGSIFLQKWEAEVSLQGDVTIAVEGSLENVQTRWGRVRTFAFLVDTNLVARAANLIVLEDPEISHAASLELTDRVKKRFRKRIDRLEQDLVEMEVIPEGTGIHRDLVSDLEGEKLRGPVEFSVSLRPKSRQLETLLSASPVEARKQFALALRELDNAYRSIDRLNDEGLPLVLWPSVKKKFERVLKDSAGVLPKTTSALRFTSGNRIARVQGTEVGVLYLRWGWTRAIGETFGEFHAIRNAHGQFAGVARERALQELVKLQRRILRAAQPVLNNSIFGSSRPHYAFFKTMFTLAGGPSELDPFVVALRHETSAGDPDEGRAYVFG